MLAATTLLLTLSGAAGSVSLLILVALAVLGQRYFDLQLDIVGMQRRGADAEAAVGNVLDSLVSEGYGVLHDVDSIVSGNIDHIVLGPTGVFIIETKSRSYELAHLKRTKMAATRVAEILDRRFVVPVICLHLRPDELRRHDGVDVVGIDRLVDFMRSRRQPPADPNDFRKLDG
jgi:hypothetical protein